MTGASLRETGSREPDPSSTGSGPTGFDPARIRSGLEQRIWNALDGEWRSLRELRLVENTKLLVGPAQSLARAGLIESKLGRQYNLVYRRRP